MPRGVAGLTAAELQANSRWREGCDRPRHVPAPLRPPRHLHPTHAGRVRRSHPADAGPAGPAGRPLSPGRTGPHHRQRSSDPPLRDQRLVAVRRRRDRKRGHRGPLRSGAARRRLQVRGYPAHGLGGQRPRRARAKADGRHAGLDERVRYARRWRWPELDERPPGAIVLRLVPGFEGPRALRRGDDVPWIVDRGDATGDRPRRRYASSTTATAAPETSSTFAPNDAYSSCRTKPRRLPSSTRCGGRARVSWRNRGLRLRVEFDRSRHAGKPNLGRWIDTSGMPFSVAGRVPTPTRPGGGRSERQALTSQGWSGILRRSAPSRSARSSRRYMPRR